MSESQTVAQVSSRSLWVLLLICAGALLVIAFTLASAIYDGQQAQAMRATQPASGTCGMQAYELGRLPLALQTQLKEDCAMLAEPAIR